MKLFQFSVHFFINSVEKLIHVKTPSPEPRSLVQYPDMLEQTRNIIHEYVTSGDLNETAKKFNMPVALCRIKIKSKEAQDYIEYLKADIAKQTKIDLLFIHTELLRVLQECKEKGDIPNQLRAIKLLGDTCKAFEQPKEEPVQPIIQIVNFGLPDPYTGTSNKSADLEIEQDPEKINQINQKYDLLKDHLPNLEELTKSALKKEKKEPDENKEILQFDPVFKFEIQNFEETTLETSIDATTGLTP